MCFTGWRSYKGQLEDDRNVDLIKFVMGSFKVEEDHMNKPKQWLKSERVCKVLILNCHVVKRLLREIVDLYIWVGMNSSTKSLYHSCKSCTDPACTFFSALCLQEGTSLCSFTKHYRFLCMKISGFCFLQ